MTNAEAIEVLRHIGGSYGDVSKYHTAIDMAIAALEKQVGKKPVGAHYAHMRCPACNHRIPSGGGSSSRRRDNWCNYCGQRIDWGDEHGADDMEEG